MLVVSQRFTRDIRDGAACSLDDRVGRGCVPLAGRPEPRVDVGGPLGNEAELERAAHALNLRRLLPLRKGLQERVDLRSPMGTASDHGRDAPGKGSGLNRLFVPLAIESPGSIVGASDIAALQGRREHHAPRGGAIDDQRHVHGELTIPLDELFGPIERVDQPKRRPTAATLRRSLV